MYTTFAHCVIPTLECIAECKAEVYIHCKDITYVVFYIFTIAAHIYLCFQNVVSHYASSQDLVTEVISKPDRETA